MKHLMKHTMQLAVIAFGHYAQLSLKRNEANYTLAALDFLIPVAVAEAAPLVPMLPLPFLLR
jgi:hypothetical protein